MKRVFEEAGIEWQPSQEMVHAVEGKPFLTEDYWGIPENKEEQVLYWNNLLDPRVEFYPGMRG